MRFLVILLSLFSCLTIQAQHTLSGKIIDNKGKPVDQAIISLKNETKGSYSNEDGLYTLHIKAGKHTLVVSSFGYETVEKSVTITGNTTLNFTLNEQSVILDHIEVYGKSKSQQMREGVFAVNALDVKPIVGNLNNLNTLIGRSSGIKIRESGSVGGSFDLSINGLSGNAIRYFINGVPLSAMGSGINLSNIPVNIVERIEVYKGTVPVELGADALGGAINIITKQEVENYLDVSYGIGSFDTHKADLNGQYTLSKSKIVIRPTLGVNFSKNSYKMKNVEIWDPEDYVFKKADFKRFHDKYFSFLGKLEAGVLQKKWADSFFISSSYSSINKELQTGVTQNIVYGKAKRKNESYALALNYSKKNLFIEGLSASFSLSQTWDKSQVVDTAFRQYNWDGSYIESSRNEITGRGRSIRNIERPRTLLRHNLTYAINNHHSLNLNYMLNHTANKRYDDFDSSFEPSKDKLTKHILGLSYRQRFWNNKIDNMFFIKDYINHLSIEQNDLGWITGSNTNDKSATKNHLGYGVGSRIIFHPTIALKASYEHSVRLPLSRELLGNGTTVYPNFKLKPENSDNLNLSLFGNIGSFSSHHLYYETGVFLRNVRDYIRLTISESEGTSQYNNIDNVSVSGWEGELKYDYAHIFEAVVNGTYVSEVNKSKFQLNGKPDITYKNRIPNTPWLYANFETSLKLHNILGQKDNMLRLSYYFQYVHWFYLTWKDYASLASKSHIPTQCTHNAQVSYSFQQNRYNISFECNNIFNRLAFDNYKMQKPGRSFFLKFRLFIN